MIEIYCDGACEPVNPGGIATYGYAIYKDGEKIREGYGLIGAGQGVTNNVAEYTALIKSLEYLIYTNKVREKIIIYSDSQLLINQLNGIYAVKSKNIIPLYDHVIRLLTSFDDASFEWIPREENEEADSLSRKAYYEYIEKNPDILEKYRRYMISDRQRRYIIGLCKKLDREIPENLNLISKREASRLINELLEEKARLRFKMPETWLEYVEESINHWTIYGRGIAIAYKLAQRSGKEDIIKKIGKLIREWIESGNPINLFTKDELREIFNIEIGRKRDIIEHIEIKYDEAMINGIIKEAVEIFKYTDDKHEKREQDSRWRDALKYILLPRLYLKIG